MPFKSSDVPGGVGWSELPFVVGAPAAAAGVLLCLVRYDADLGSDGLGLDWKEERLLTSGDDGAELAGDRWWEGGV